MNLVLVITSIGIMMIIFLVDLIVYWRVEKMGIQKRNRAERMRMMLMMKMMSLMEEVDDWRSLMEETIYWER